MTITIPIWLLWGLGFIEILVVGFAIVGIIFFWNRHYFLVERD